MSAQGCYVVAEYFLGWWSTKSLDDQQDDTLFLIYCLLVVGVVILSLTRAVLFMDWALNGLQFLFD